MKIGKMSQEERGGVAGFSRRLLPALPGPVFFTLYNHHKNLYKAVWFFLQ
jgi:hypothetical protein